MKESSMRKLLIVCICLCCIFPIAQSSIISQNQKTLSSYQTSLLNGGWVEEQNNITILHVSGTHYQMGYQHGYLLKDKVQQNIRAFLHYAEQYLPLTELLAYWNISKPYVPTEYIEEMQGIADGANISFNDIMTAIMAIEYADHGCYGIAAWGIATIDGRLYHVRSFDLPSTIQDPVSGRYAHENAILVIRNPENGSASIAPAIAGSFHTGGGMNSHGICLGIQICWSKDQTFEGNPYHFRVQQVLDSATTAEEALTILNTNRTHGFNFIVSQADPAIGYALEQTVNLTYIGTYNDSVENNKPFWAIEHVVRRTNVFLDSTIAATQRTPYNPSGLIAFLKLLFTPQTNPYFAISR
jgi:predicted choloylglycine hydrolase